MKLRIRNQSVRLRLSQGEVAQVARGEAVEMTTSFAGSTALVCRLEGADAEHPEATFADGTLTVRLPARTARDWAAGDGVTFPGGDETALRILVEKDFQCLAPREGEDETDLYPHPEAGTSTC